MRAYTCRRPPIRSPGQSGRGEQAPARWLDVYCCPAESAGGCFEAVALSGVPLASTVPQPCLCGAYSAASPCQWEGQVTCFCPLPPARPASCVCARARVQRIVRRALVRCERTCHGGGESSSALRLGSVCLCVGVLAWAAYPCGQAWGRVVEATAPTALALLALLEVWALCVCHDCMGARLKLVAHPVWVMHRRRLRDGSGFALAVARAAGGKAFSRGACRFWCLTVEANVRSLDGGWVQGVAEGSIDLPLSCLLVPRSMVDHTRPFWLVSQLDRV